MDDQQAMQNFKDNIALLIEKFGDDSIIIDNKLPFWNNGKMYRVKMPSQKELSKVENFRNQMQVEFLQQPGCITRENLKKVLKDNAVIDIEALEKQKEELLVEIKQLYYSLATKHSDNIETINLLKDKIETIRKQIEAIAIKIADKLYPCLESRIEKSFVEYLTFLCTEQLTPEDKWLPLWINYEEFENADASLTQKAITSMTWLFINRKEF